MVQSSSLKMKASKKDKLVEFAPGRVICKQNIRRLCENLNKCFVAQQYIALSKTKTKNIYIEHYTCKIHMKQSREIQDMRFAI